MRQQLRHQLESEQQAAALTSSPSAPSDGLEDLTAAQLTELTDEAKQAEYRRQYLLQMQRRNCPGCGDTPVF